MRSFTSILHLEDSPLDAELTATELERAGLACTVDRVATREEFVAALNRGGFDLVLADFALPGFDGLDALDLVRARYPGVPFIMLSGRMGEEVAVETLKRGATDYVLKNRLGRLGPAVRRALAEVREREDRRRAEDALHETEERFRALADAAPLMIWMAGPAKGVEYLSRHWEEFTGRGLGEDAGDGWMGNVHPEDLQRVLETYAIAFDRREHFTIEYRVRRRDGDYRWIVSHGVPRFAPGGEFLGYVGSCMDVSELKRTEESLRHAAKLESLGVLAGGIAHDFNNLLTGIIGNACLLQDEVQASPERVRLVDNILQAGETAARLTRQILAYSGKGQFVVEPLDLSAAVREMVPLLEASVPKHVELRFSLASGLPSVEGDLGQIQQVIMNLMINGAEAIGDRPGWVEATTYFENGVVLEVRDTGAGMDEATRGRIFDPFFTTKFTGRGLGLAAVSGIVRGHRGEIQVDSQPGQGTTFRVVLPAAGGRPATEPGRCLVRPVRGNEVVLLADDEEVVRRFAQIGLQRMGYQVLVAANGREAVELLERQPNGVDVVVLDLMMPVMSGWEALPHIRRLAPRLKVIASSGYTEAEAVRRFGDRIDTFLQKPYRAQQLGELIRSLLQSPA